MASPKSSGRNISFDRDMMRQVFNDSLKKVQEDEIVEKNKEMNMEKIRKEEELRKKKELNRERCWITMIKSIEKFYNSLAFTIFLSAVIFFSLFIRDLWLAIFRDRDTDSYCDVLLWFIFIFFIIESLLNSLMFKQYRMSFIFAIDTISTLTILIDVSSVPGIDAVEYRKIKNSIFFKIFKLFSVLKLWRATRLFFRKNQTKEYIPINENTLGINQGVFVRELANKSFLKKRKGLTLKDNQVQKDTAPTKTPQSKNSKESYLVLPNKIENKEANDNNKIEYSFHIGNELQPSRYVVQGPSSESRNNISGLLGKPEISVIAYQDKEPLEAKDLSVNLDKSQAESSKKELKKVNRTLNFKSIVLRGSNKNFSFNINGYQKERDRARLRVSNNTFILNNRLEASGNIRKTISYRNVGTIACTVLMANLGLSVFVSSLYYENKPVCFYDLENAFDILSAPSTRDNKTIIENFYQNRINKYQSQSLKILSFKIHNFINFQSSNLSKRRDEELISCKDDRVLSDGLVYSAGISIDDSSNVLWNSLFNIMRNIFIVVILIYNILMNNRDIKYIIMDPIEHIYEESSKLSVNPLTVEDTMEANRELFKTQSGLNTEWVKISRLINFSTYWMVNTYGNSSENFLSQAINLEDFELKKCKGEEVHGVFCYLDTTKLWVYLGKLIDNDNFIEIYNKCIGLIHQEVSLMRGEIYSTMPGTYLFAWQFSDREMIYEDAPEKDLTVLKSSVIAKAELAITSIISSLFKLRVFLRNFTYTEHDKLSFRLDGLVSMGVHSGSAIKGAVGGDQKIDISLTSKAILVTKKLTELGMRHKCDVVISETVHEMLCSEVDSLNRDFRDAVRN